MPPAGGAGMSPTPTHLGAPERGAQQPPGGWGPEGERSGAQTEWALGLHGSCRGLEAPNQTLHSSVSVFPWLRKLKCSESYDLPEVPVHQRPAKPKCSIPSPGAGTVGSAPALHPQD